MANNKKVFMSTNGFIKKSLIYFLFVSFLTLFATQVAKAEETGTVTATVTAQNISVTITTDGSVAFSTIGVDSTKDTGTGAEGVDDTETAQNNGNVIENFNIRATDSSSWTLAGTAGNEIFTMKSCIAGCDEVSPTWTSVGEDPTYVTLASGIATTNSQDFDLQVGTPTTTAVFDQQTITVTIQAVIGA